MSWKTGKDKDDDIGIYVYGTFPPTPSLNDGSGCLGCFGLMIFAAMFAALLISK